MVRRVDNHFDFFGNLILSNSQGNTNTLNDDVIVEQFMVVEDHVMESPAWLLANRPYEVRRRGLPNSMPAGSTLSRTTRIFYDGMTSTGSLVRGNPTRIEQDWKGGYSGCAGGSKF